ncbi:MAG: GGDEF domain-containing protein [archaeon]|nr:GGDEF domain-containing protein [archaeon]
MITNLLKDFLSTLIDIDVKEETNNIKLRSILKIYVYVGVLFTFLNGLFLIIDQQYIAGIATFIYWLILVLFIRIGDYTKLTFTESILVITTIVYCAFEAFTLGGEGNYQALIFLIIPIVAGDAEKSKKKKIFYFISTGILYVLMEYRFVFVNPIWIISNWIMFLISLSNGMLVFFSLVLHTLLCDMYSDTTIDKLKEDKKLLDKDSKMDHLTGLYNRRSMERYLTTLEEQYHITNKPFGLILFDIDFFKKVNDTYGHQAGDKVLAEISRLIVYSLRKSDEVFRYGGEEILAVVTGVQSKEDLIKVANNIRSDIESLKIPCDDIDVSVTISAGTTLFDGSEIDSIIKRVDEALYTAKNNGRNRVEYL